MAKVSQIYTVPLAGQEIVKYVRIKNEETGMEKLLEPHELEDPDDVAIDDEYAYKVNLLSENIFSYLFTY